MGCRLREDQTVSPAPEALATCGLFADPAVAAGMVLWSWIQEKDMGRKKKKIPCDFPDGSCKELVRHMLGS